MAAKFLHYVKLTEPIQVKQGASRETPTEAIRTALNGRFDYVAFGSKSWSESNYNKRFANNNPLDIIRISQSTLSCVSREFPKVQGTDFGPLQTGVRFRTKTLVREENVKSRIISE